MKKLTKFGENTFLGNKNLSKNVTNSFLATVSSSNEKFDVFTCPVNSPSTLFLPLKRDV